MSLLDCLMPASPPDPKDVRTVRLLGADDVPVSRASQLRAQKAYYQRNRPDLKAKQRDRYWASKGNR